VLAGHNAETTGKWLALWRSSVGNGPDRGRVSITTPLISYERATKVCPASKREFFKQSQSLFLCYSSAGADIASLGFFVSGLTLAIVGIAFIAIVVVLIRTLWIRVQESWRRKTVAALEQKVTSLESEVQRLQARIAEQRGRSHK
jgi:hypothetical protein